MIERSQARKRYFILYKIGLVAYGKDKDIEDIAEEWDVPVEYIFEVRLVK